MENANRRTSESLVIIQRTGGGVDIARCRRRRGGEKPAVGQPSASRAQSEFSRRRRQVLCYELRTEHGYESHAASAVSVIYCEKCGRSASSDIFAH